MFARNVSLRLKPNTLSEFTRIFEKEVIPMLRKQSGFRDEIAFAVPGGLDVVAISLWDTKEYAEAYRLQATPKCSRSWITAVRLSCRVLAASNSCATS